MRKWAYLSLLQGVQRFRTKQRPAGELLSKPWQASRGTLVLHHRPHSPERDLQGPHMWQVPASTTEQILQLQQTILFLRTSPSSTYIHSSLSRPETFGANPKLLQDDPYKYYKYCYNINKNTFCPSRWGLCPAHCGPWAKENWWVFTQLRPRLHRRPVRHSGRTHLHAVVVAGGNGPQRGQGVHPRGQSARQQVP